MSANLRNIIKLILGTLGCFALLLATAGNSDQQ